MAQTARALVAIGALTALAGLASGQTTQGPDVIVGELPSCASYGPVAVSGQTYHAFAVGTTSCNKGNQTLQWIASTNRHPVIGQNLFRWRVVNGAGQFEQVGQSWLKHGFTALQQNACNLGCVSSGTGSALGVGCSDPYSAGLNGSQSGLGPRHQVNAHTGAFTYPFTAPAASTAIHRRLQVRGTDLAVTAFSSTTAKYYVEGQYIAPDDAEAGHGNNNSSYRRVSVSFASPQFILSTSTTYPTVRERAAIYAWQDAEPGVTIVPWDVPGEGRFLLGYKVTQVGAEYHYEYVVQNMNSDRSAGGFRVNFPGNSVSTTLEGFRDVEYHSGEPYANTDWGMTKNASGITWNNGTDFATNANANALRWGTAYSFRFRSDRAPVMGTVSLDLFKPGTPGSMDIAAMVPSAPSCPSIDFNNDGLFPAEEDFIDLLSVFAGGPCSTGNCNSIDINSDGIFPADEDIALFLTLLAGGTC